LNKIEETESLEYWFQMIFEPKFKNTKIYEEFENYANKEWVNFIAGDLEVSDDPLELMKNYLALLVHMGTIKKNDITAEKKGDNIILHITGKYLPLIRNGKIYSYILEVALGKYFEYEVEQEKEGIKINLHPGTISLRVILSRRTGRGSIRVSDKDLKKLDMDLIENVTVVPLGKDTGLTEMMFSASNVTPGYVMVNVSDASLIGLKEGDKVMIYKRQSDTEDPTSKIEEKTPNEKSPENAEDEVKDTGKTVENQDETPKENLDENQDKKQGKINQKTESQGKPEPKTNLDNPIGDDKTISGKNIIPEKSNSKKKDETAIQSSQSIKSKKKENSGNLKVKDPKVKKAEKNDEDSKKQKGPDEKMMKDFEDKIEQLRND
jgi:hypothetical protein